jgi:hypothetical protein
MIERIIDLKTGKITERPYTAEEIAEVYKSIEENNILLAEQTAKAEAKASAMAKLAALGLNDEEIQAIVGGIIE